MTPLWMVPASFPVLSDQLEAIMNIIAIRDDSRVDEVNETSVPRKLFQ